MSNLVPFLEIETKYDASEISRLDFKKLMRSSGFKSFLYVESTDIYYSKSPDDFLRHRLSPESDNTKRSELTLKRKTNQGNNIVRTEINLRVDGNDPFLVQQFVKTLGYERNFSIYKMCDIYWFEDADIVYYSVLDEEGKTASFIEIEVDESRQMSETEAWAVLLKYEKLLAALGLNAQKRMRRSLWEMYRT